MDGKTGTELFSYTAWKDSLPTTLAESQGSQQGILIFVGEKYIFIYFIHVFFLYRYIICIYFYPAPPSPQPIVGLVYIVN